MCGVRVRTLVRLGWAFLGGVYAKITVRVRVGREYMVSEMVEIFFSQYLANFETRGCGGDFSPQNLRATLRFRDICKKRLNSFTISLFPHDSFANRHICVVDTLWLQHRFGNWHVIGSQCYLVTPIAVCVLVTLIFTRRFRNCNKCT